jgi:hypothetical protein
MSTGTYAVGNVAFSLQPTSGKWSSRSPIGITGDGHEIYGRTHEFECRWSLSTQASIFQLHNYFLAVGISGTVVVSLPEYGSAAYEFKNYSGCTLSELQRSDYFAEHTQDVRLLIRNIIV